MTDTFTHFDETGASRMVDVGEKPVSARSARASGRIVMADQTLRRLLDKQFEKGDVLEVARLAGIMGAKRTSDLIPLCHPLSLTSVAIGFEPKSATELEVVAVCKVDSRTGVEMEALTAVAVACLTVYDMCKSVDRGLTIAQIRLEEKTGGVKGPWVRDAD